MSNCSPGPYTDSHPSLADPTLLPGGQPFRVTACYQLQAYDKLLKAAAQSPANLSLDVGLRTVSFDYPDAKQAEQAWKRLKLIDGVSVEVEN